VIISNYKTVATPNSISKKDAEISKIVGFMEDATLPTIHSASISKSSIA
jgi:hypothetical protein